MIKFSQYTDTNSKTNTFDSDFPAGVLMYQNCQISLPLGYKAVRQNQETGNDCDVISGFKALRKTDFSDIFLFSYKQCSFVPFFSEFTSSESENVE